MIFIGNNGLEELKKLRKDFDGKLVWTNGCFDILHEGHKDYLKKASELGDYLVVGLNSDDSVRRLKGRGRPINKVLDRCDGLYSLDYIDYVFIFDELSPLNCLRELKPDIYVKGGDYNLNSINQEERRLVEGYGGRIVIIPKVHDVSTSGIVEGLED